MITNDMFTGVLNRDVAREISLIQLAQDNPIYATLVAAGRRRTAQAEKVEWFTGNITTRRTQVNNGSTAYDETTTGIVVDSVAPFKAGHLVLCEATGEIMYITSISSLTLTVIRGVGGQVAAAAGSVANNAYLTSLGFVAGEGTGAPPYVSTDLNAPYNFMETFKETVQVSGRRQRVGVLTEDDRSFRRREKFELLMRNIEHRFLFGARDNDNDDAAGNRITTMGGLLQHITTNITNIGGTMDAVELRSALGVASQYGSGTKLLFCGSLVLEAIATLYDGKLRLAPSDDRIGLRPRTFLSEWGTEFTLIPHRALQGVYAGYAIAVDPAQAEVIYMAGKDGQTGEPVLQADLQDNDEDAIKDQWFAELTLGWGDEKTHAIIKGVTGAA
jgi:hypothetical protein